MIVALEPDADPPKLSPSMTFSDCWFFSTSRRTVRMGEPDALLSAGVAAV